jgi:hypothetical protein
MDARVPIVAVAVTVTVWVGAATGAVADTGSTDAGAAAPFATAPVATAPSAAAPVAEVGIHGTAQETGALGNILTDLLAHRASLRLRRADRIDATEVIRPAPRSPAGSDVVARAWIDLGDAGQVTLYVVDRGWERILVRHIDRGNAPSEVVLESTARIVATAVEALLTGAQIGVVREELARPATPPADLDATARPASAVPATPGAAARIGAFYGAQLFAPTLVLIHGPGICVGGAAGSGRVQPGAILTGQLWLPSTVTDRAVGLRLLSGSLRLLGTADYVAGSRVTLTAGLGGGIDVTRIDALALGEDVHPTATTTLTTGVLRAAVGTSIRMRWGLGLSVTGAVDADLSGTRYVVKQDGATYDFLRPWAVRPGLMLGVIAP